MVAHGTAARARECFVEESAVERGRSVHPALFFVLYFSFGASGGFLSGAAQNLYVTGGVSTAAFGAVLSIALFPQVAEGALGAAGRHHPDPEDLVRRRDPGRRRSHRHRRLLPVRRAFDPGAGGRVDRGDRRRQPRSEWRPTA